MLINYLLFDFILIWYVLVFVKITLFYKYKTHTKHYALNEIVKLICKFN